jgi:hypothetical protein
MMKWIYRLSDGEFTHGGPYEPDFNPATHGLLESARHPDPRQERYDGAGGIRPATEQEIIEHDTAKKDTQSLSQFDSEKLVKALAIWTAGKLTVPLGQAKAEILVILKGLP